MDLTTTAVVKGYIRGGGEPLSSDNDTQIGRMITLWSKRAATMMNRTVTTATYTEYFDVAPGQRRFSLKAIPVSTLASVYDDPTWGFSTGEVGTDSRIYDPTTGILSLVYYQPTTGVRSLRVIYRGGMGTSAGSFAVNYPEISDAVAMQVAHAWKRKGDFGKTSVSDPVGNRNYTGEIGWLRTVKDTLMEYRRYTFGR